MSHNCSNYLVPKARIDSWWRDIEPERLNCDVSITKSTMERDGTTYRRISFTRLNDQVVATSLPGPIDQADIFIVSVGSPSRSRSLWDEIDSSLVQLGATCVHRAN
jgi:hypothetical protein